MTGLLETFDPIPSWRQAARVAVAAAGGDHEVVGVPVASSGDLPAEVAVSRPALSAAGFDGILSSIASDAGYLVLIPLGAVAFLSVGRHPLAGLAAAFAAVGGRFGVNVLITPIDGIITEVTNESAALVDPSKTISLTANLFFGIGSTLFLAILITFVTEKIVEPRLGRLTGTVADEATSTADGGPGNESRGCDTPSGVFSLFSPCCWC